MAGAIDLFSGNNSITGTNLFKISNNPLFQLDQGVGDVIGQQGQWVGNQFANMIQALISNILGIPFKAFEPFTDIEPLFLGLEQYFQNLLGFLGGLDPLDPNFWKNLMGYAEQFLVFTILPTNLVSMLVPLQDIFSPSFVQGFIPLENLALDILNLLFGNAPALLKAILAAFGMLPQLIVGSIEEMIQLIFTLFNQIWQFLGGIENAVFGSLFDLEQMISNFILSILAPSNLLPILDPVSGLLNIFHIPNLDASQITSGVFANHFIPGLQQTWNSIVSSLGGPATGNVLSDVEYWLQQGLGGAAGGSIQGVIDAILSSVGIGAGLGTLTQVEQYFGDLLKMLGLPDLTSGIFDPVTAVEDFINQMLSPTGLLALPSDIQGIITGITDLTGGNFGDLTTYFNNLESMLGIASGSFTGGAFNPITAVTNFITSMQLPTGLLAPLLGDASQSAGVTGFVPMENLDTALLQTIIGGAQQVIDAILSTVGFAPGAGTAADVTSYFTDFLQMFANPALTSTGFDPVTAVTNFITDMLAPTNMLAPLNPASLLLNPVNIPGLDATKITSGIFPTSLIPGLDASQIVSGNFSPFLLSLIPVSSIGNTNPNLLANPTYATAASVPANPSWVWDGTVTHTADGSGSVKAICNGTALNLMSDPQIQVSAGQQLACSQWIMWSNVVGSGPCFQLSVLPYLGANPAGSTVLQTITDPATNGTWQQLTGTYTVPASGVDNIRLELQILVGATGGTTWWDDGSVTKVQLLAQSWTAGLPGDLSNLQTGIDASALQSDLISVVNTLGLGSYTSVPPSLSDITSRLQGLDSTGILSASSLQGLDATKIISGVLSIGQIPTNLIGAANITDLQTVIDGIYQAMNGGSSVGNPASSVLPSLLSIPGLNIITALLPGVIPGLDATKITSGKLSTGSIPNITAGMSTDMQSIVDQINKAMGTGVSVGNPVASIQAALTSIPGLNVVSTLAPGVIPDITKAMSSDLQKTITNLYGGTAIGVVLQKPAIPNITLGMSTDMQTLVDYAYQAMHGGSTTNHPIIDFKNSLMSIPGANIISALLPAVIPNITAPMSTDMQSMITSLWGGTAIGTILQTAAIPNITKGMSSDLQTVITNLYGTPSIGTLLQASAIPNITLPMSTSMQSIVDQIFQASHGGVSTGNPLTSVKTSLTSIPGGNIISTLSQGVIPSLTSGWGGTVASSLLTGLLNVSSIPGLPASQITSGTFLQNLIPSLTSGWSGNIASSLLTGVLNLGNIPALPIGQITNLSNYLSHLNTSGVLDAVTSVTGLSGYLGYLNTSGVYVGTLPISQIVSLSGYLTYLNPFGQFTSAAGLPNLFQGIAPTATLSRSNINDLGTTYTAAQNAGTAQSLSPGATYTAPVAGTYQFDLCYYLGAPVLNAWNAMPVLITSVGTFNGPDAYGFGIATIGYGPRSIKSSWTVNLPAGGSAQGTYSATGNPPFTGGGYFNCHLLSQQVT